MSNVKEGDVIVFKGPHGEVMKLEARYIKGKLKLVSELGIVFPLELVKDTK